ncbi:MAG: hypothetical protein L3J22_09135 [Xanthomonadales bacterium]|nr:hypothetical protein [Xanthomonadales bacterium]
MEKEGEKKDEIITFVEDAISLDDVTEAPAKIIFGDKDSELLPVPLFITLKH